MSRVRQVPRQVEPEGLDEAVRVDSRRRDPTGCLPVVLALVAGGIIAAVTARSVRWYFVGLASIAGTAVMFLALSAFRVVGWTRQHPLLADLFKLRRRFVHDESAEFDILEASVAIVDQYLPPDESKPLLERLDAAKARVEKSIGASDG